MKLVSFSDTNNFGDVLSKPIMDKVFNTNFQVVHSIPDTNHFFGIGSILAHANSKSTVFGSGVGALAEGVDRTAKFIAVRGPYSAIAIGNKDITLGDPAYLLSHFYPEFYSCKKKHDISIVPHYVDYKHAKEKYVGMNVIDVINEDPFNVLEQICSSQRILSSSLHGIIAAQSFGIPSTWVRMGDRLFGDDIKFYDTYASVGDRPEKFRTYNEQIKQIQTSLLQSARQL